MCKIEEMKGSASKNNRFDFFAKRSEKQVLKQQPQQNLNTERYRPWTPQQEQKYHRKLLSPTSDKYWKKRYSLFSRYGEGIILDDESWYSVTPEKLAKHHTQRLACDVIVDGFCGAGGNSIQFAMTCKKVIAIDVDPCKIEIAKHNAIIYGVVHKIQFIVGDFIKLAPTLKADIVFLAPPWGGPDYVRKDVFCLEEHLVPVSIHTLLNVARIVSPNVAAFLPRNSNTGILYEKYRVEVEANYVGKYQNAITVYWGELVRGSNTVSYVKYL